MEVMISSTCMLSLTILMQLVIWQVYGLSCEMVFAVLHEKNLPVGYYVVTYRSGLADPGTELLGHTDAQGWLEGGEEWVVVELPIRAVLGLSRDCVNGIASWTAVDVESPCLIRNFGPNSFGSVLSIA